MDYCQEDGHWVIDIVTDLPESKPRPLEEVAPEPKWRPADSK
jgi:hypothetical protein